MGVDCLKACSACSRHVRCGERTCPFCGTAIQFFMSAPEYRLKTRLDRGAMFALGAAFGAAGILLACDNGATGALYGGSCNSPACDGTSTTVVTGGGGGSGSDGIVLVAAGASAGGAAGAPVQPSDGGEAGAHDLPSDGAKP
jgi:hypothetical protein